MKRPVVRTGDGKYGCLSCNTTLLPVRGKGNRGKRKCPKCGFTIRLPDRRKLRGLAGRPGKDGRIELKQEGDNWHES